MASGATAREVLAEIQYGLRPTEAPCAQSVLRARAMASRQPYDALDARQSEFCGEDTTAGVDMRKLRFRPRPSCPGGRGALAYCFSPSRSPSTRWDRPRKPGTRRDDRRRYAALDNASRDGEGEPRTRGLAFEDRWGHRAPSFS